MRRGDEHGREQDRRACGGGGRGAGVVPITAPATAPMASHTATVQSMLSCDGVADEPTRSRSARPRRATCRGRVAGSCGRRCTSPGTMRMPPPTPNKPGEEAGEHADDGDRRRAVRGHGGRSATAADVLSRLMLVQLGRPERRATGRSRRPSGPGAFSSSGGVSRRQMSWTSGQRVWKRQPGGGSIGLGISPCSTMRWRARCSGGSGIGTLDSRASV